MNENRRSRLATVREAASYLRRSPTTLARWRREGTGPAYLGGGSQGQTVYYRWSDLDAYVDASVRQTEAPSATRWRRSTCAIHGI